MSDALQARFEAMLADVARARATLTYRDAAAQLELQPPQTIRQLTDRAEALMRRNAAREEPQLASVLVSRVRRGIPAPGYFLLMTELGLYAGDVDGDAAVAAHEAELERVYRYWGEGGAMLDSRLTAVFEDGSRRSRNISPTPRIVPFSTSGPRLHDSAD